MTPLDHHSLTRLYEQVTHTAYLAHARGAHSPARAFGLPVRWELKSGLRARLGFQQTQTQSYVQNLFAAGSRSRLTDNGRQAFTLNADTDVADNATFSIQGSRIVNFDRNLNRRLTQTVITAVLQMQFFAGDLR